MSFVGPPEAPLDVAVQRLLILDSGDGLAPTLRKALGGNGRHDVVTVRSGEELPLQANVVTELCVPAQCDALMTLRVDEAQELATITVSVYDPTGEPLDEAVLPIDGFGIDAAVSGVAARFAVHDLEAVRLLEVVGHRGLAEGAALAAAGRWDDASVAWRALVVDARCSHRVVHASGAWTGGTAILVAKARHNLAIAMEPDDRLDRALQPATPSRTSSALQPTCWPSKRAMPTLASLTPRSVIWRARHGFRAADSEGVAGED